MISIGIVGGGSGGNAVLRAIHGLTDVSVIGISDLNRNALGGSLRPQYRRGLLPGFPGTAAEKSGYDHRSHGQRRSAGTDSPRQRASTAMLVESDVAKLIMDMFDAKERMIGDLNEQSRQLAAMAQQLSATVQQFAAAAQELAAGAENLAEPVQTPGNQYRHDKAEPVRDRRDPQIHQTRGHRDQAAGFECRHRVRTCRRCRERIHRRGRRDPQVGGQQRPARSPR